MRFTSAAVVLAAVFLISPPAGAQGIPGSPAFLAARAGWDAIREGRHQDAATAFANAVDAEPRDPSFHYGAGVAAFLLGRPTTARHSLERALALAPSLTAASLLLGHILYRGSDIDGALRVYEAAIRHARDNGELAGRIATLRKEALAHRDYFTSRGAHFTVLFDGPADEPLAARAVEVLEGAYWRVATALALYPEGQITVILYTTQQFRDITRSPEWSAGVYDGRIRIPVRGTIIDSRELERVLTHEFTHALVTSVVPSGIPTWLHEGLAVAFEPEGEKWARTQLAETTSRLPLSRLAKSFGGLARPEARLAYAQSAGVVGAMLERGGAMAIGAMLQDIARGASFPAAFERQYFTSYEDFVVSLP